MVQVGNRASADDDRFLHGASLRQVSAWDRSLTVPRYKRGRGKTTTDVFESVELATEKRHELYKGSLFTTIFWKEGQSTR
jgi:hypothetical protein